MKGDHLLMFSRKIRKKCVAENMMVKMIKTFPPQNAQHRSSLIIRSIKANPRRSKPAQKNLILIGVIMDLKQGGFTVKFVLFIFTSEN